MSVSSPVATPYVHVSNRTTTQSGISTNIPQGNFCQRELCICIAAPMLGSFVVRCDRPALISRPTSAACQRRLSPLLLLVSSPPLLPHRSITLISWENRKRGLFWNSTMSEFEFQRPKFAHFEKKLRLSRVLSFALSMFESPATMLQEMSCALRAQLP